MAKILEKELKRGTLEMLLLKLISTRPMYGYEIVTLLEKRAGQLQLKESTLYPVLYRLEKDGYILARWETLERGVPRKYYQLTEAGQDELSRLIGEWQEFTRVINGFIESVTTNEQSE
ncbi:MAG: lineage-specific thermal regulator protein [Chloroflexi bacterium]|nr:lineage-specific thermal regulator protein [Chloroflexota bacterium]